MPNEYFFTTEGLAVGYNRQILISDICIKLERGKILTLIGPNGSGKSTILKSITRHLTPITGEIFIGEHSINRMDRKQLARQLSVVLTERIRPELMTCGELVASGRYPYTDSFGRLTDADKRIVKDALARVHAQELYDREFTAISDGQRQRIMLARALAQEPEIMVLDEPTSYLDIRHKIELLDILSDMARNRNITIIMSLHEIDLAYKISDTIAFVKGDHIAAIGSPDDILDDEAVKQLYSIGNGSYNALLGCTELKRPEGAPRAFVIGGAGKGIPVYRALQKRGIPFAAGILFENDIDCPVATALSENIVTAKAFCPITEAEIDAAKKLISNCEIVIDSGCSTGDMNRANDLLRRFAGEKLSRRIPEWL